MTTTTATQSSALAGLGFGVLWHVWTLYGFWWGVLYGLFWPVWLGYRLAAWLLP